VLLQLGWIKGIFLPDECLDAAMGKEGLVGVLFVWQILFSVGRGGGPPRGCRDRCYHLHGMEQEEATVG